MLHLFIDTATERPVVGLFLGEQLIESCIPLPGIRATKEIMPAIAALLHAHGRMPADLDFVGVGRGPGSFTGLRVGIALAKGIALGCGIPLVAVGSLEGYIAEKSQLVVAAIDARIGGIFGLVGKIVDNQRHIHNPPELLPIEAFIDVAARCDCIVTPHATRIAARLPANFIVPIVEMTPALAVFGALSLAAFQAGEGSLQAYCDVLYLRKTQVELSPPTM